MRMMSSALMGAAMLVASGSSSAAQQPSPVLVNPTARGTTLGQPADPSAPFRPATPNQPITAGASTAPVATVAPPTPEGGVDAAPVLGTPAARAPAAASAPRPTPTPAAQPQGKASDLAPEAAGKPAGPGAAKTTEYGDWTLECFTPAVAGLRCQASSRVLSADVKQSVLVFSLTYDPAADQSRVQIALPLGFSLPQGVQIDIGSSYQSSIAVNRCTAQGCLVEGMAAPELIQAMRREREGAVTVRTTELVPIRLPLSLKGFAETIDAMHAENEREVAGQ